jgi:uncharacterized membrane protein
MVKKISLSAMIFTYLFAGLAHFIKFRYYLSLVPAFFRNPSALVGFMGGIQLLLALLLAFARSRKIACYGIILLWSAKLPFDAYVLMIGGAGIPLPHWMLIAALPFHLALILWAYWQIRVEPKPAGA